MPTRSKTIWTMWYQGLNTAPALVRLCVESWRRHHPEWKVVVLDRDSLSTFVDLTKIIDTKRKDLTVQKIAAVTRLCLLKEYGGVWTDATVFCARPLEQWLPEHLSTGFFAFRNPGPDRLMSNWLIAAESDSILLRRLHRAFLDLWRDNYFSFQNTRFARYAIPRLTGRFNENPSATQFWFTFVARKILRMYPYFIFHYTFNKLILEDEQCRDAWYGCKGLEADSPHRLQYLRRREDGLTQALAEIDQGVFTVCKLDWRLDPEDEYWRAVLARLSASLLEQGAAAPAEAVVDRLQ